MFEGVKVKTSTPGAFKDAINEAGWLEDEVVAAGHLRQGQAVRASIGQIWEQLQLLLPARSKKVSSSASGRFQ